MPGIIYLCPVPISTRPYAEVIPSYNCDVMSKLNTFFVEKRRTAIRFIRKMCPEKDLSDCTFIEIGKRIDFDDIERALESIIKGNDAGLLSEAGCPSIADPGKVIVEIAHKKGIRVIPLVGPSSILLALMASGQNGQNFSFNGYLPRDKEELKKKIKELGAKICKSGETQIFIETPYRNQRLLEALQAFSLNHLLLTVATDITGDEERIITLPIEKWKKIKETLPEQPSIFILGQAL